MQHSSLPAATLVASLTLAGLAACGGGGQPVALSHGSPAIPSEGASSSTPSTTAGGASRGLVVFDGDSLTYGFMVAPTQSYPAQAMAGLPTWLSWVNVAVSGQTWPDLLSDVAREVDSLYDPRRRLNLVVAWAAANDLAVGYTARECFENARRYCEGRRRVGFTVVILTMYPLEPKGFDHTYEGRRMAYNQLLRARWSEFADALVDLAADERLGDNSGPQRSAYFLDPVHLNASGYAVVAACVADALAPFVARAAE
jgi:lysophospholipase L1-like esterase